MTTIVTFATKDVIVMGGDSLGTASRNMVDIVKLFQYFDAETGLVKKDKNDEPLLSNFWDHIYLHREDLPYSHMTHVDKIFKLYKNIGVATAGLISIGDRTLKSIIQELMTEGIYPCEDATKELVNKIQEYYEKEYSNLKVKPPIELLVAGWDQNDNRPKVFRVNFPPGNYESALNGGYGISFGGQYREIARLIHGTDVHNMDLIEGRYKSLLMRFANKLQESKQDIALPDLDDFCAEYRIFGLENPDDSNSDLWRLNGFDANYSDFSDQNAINCVYWLIELMIRVQEFGNSMPTVGGDIHIAIIDRKDGFRFISEESYNLQGHITPKD